MRNLTAAITSALSSRVLRNLCFFLAVGAMLIYSISSGAQGDFIVSLTNIPGVDFEIAPVAADTVGAARCTRLSFVVIAHADARCPNGAAALNEAATTGVVGGPQVQSSGITYRITTGMPIHQEYKWTNCSPTIPSRQYAISSFHHCFQNAGIPQVGMGSCTTPSINGSCPTGTVPDPVSLLCCRPATQAECQFKNYYWNFGNNTCYVIQPSPTTSAACSLLGWFWNFAGGTCSLTPPPPGGCGGLADWGLYPTTGCMSGFIYSGGSCTRSSSFITQCSRFGGYEPDSCSCTGGCDPEFPCSPILVDIDGDGFALTDAANGVDFDVSGDGVAERRAWTEAGSDDAWLALDRDGNGTIDGGRELFGNASPQPPPPAGGGMNGFFALAQYDEAAYGGNGDGLIGQEDSVFSSLRLWRDANHNGVSEVSELSALRDSGLKAIGLSYKESKRVDEHGNSFRYRAKVWEERGPGLGRWAWDVFLVGGP